MKRKSLILNEAFFYGYNEAEQIVFLKLALIA